MSSADREYISSIDKELKSIVSNFAILGPLSWPKDVQQQFLEGRARGEFVFPDKIEYNKVDVSPVLDALNTLNKKIGTNDHPALIFLKRNIESYILGYNILKGVGTEDVNHFSRELYGHPHDVLPIYEKYTIDVARYFLDIAESYNISNTEETLVYSAEELRDIVQSRVAEIIDKDKINITIDSSLVARASAGPDYVKIRAGTRFSEGDVDQLLHHEVFTHTLTYINGANQPVLRCLGYAAPRTTGTQEGLATFSEYINGSFDLTRLKRIALRILALDAAINGADLVDLFNFFKRHGQNDEESYLSSMRILRGGHPKGGVIFFKDNVYLSGLIEVESFLKTAMHESRLHDMTILFTGKLTTEDIKILRPLAEDGLVEIPKYLPKWIQHPQKLAATLAFNDLTGRFRLGAGKKN
ncbi:MAG: hypothetical protein K0R98_1931 [Rickettsiaceae bacterium]|jgi:uncharacterized protein (TIGR02421 family)|nr:hypothetical protein [Rickettsiaceae bacterium]